MPTPNNTVVFWIAWVICGVLFSGYLAASRGLYEGRKFWQVVFYVFTFAIGPLNLLWLLVPIQAVQAVRAKIDGK